MTDDQTLGEIVLLFAEISVYVPPHQRDEMQRLAVAILQSMPPSSALKLGELAKARGKAKQEARDRQDEQMTWTKAPPLPSDPDLVWRLAMLRGRRVAIEAWLAGENHPEEALLDVQEEDAALRAEIYGR
jgi:hypothetical protein